MPHETVEMTEEIETDMSDAFPATEETTEETVSEGGEELSVDEEEAENPTALLPRAALGKGAKIGDTVTLKVVAIHGDDEIEVALSQGKRETKEPKTANAEIDEMDAMVKY